MIARCACAHVQDEKCQLQSEMLAVRAAGESSAQPSAATAALEKARCMRACCAAWAGRRAWQGVCARVQLIGGPTKMSLGPLAAAGAAGEPTACGESAAAGADAGAQGCGPGGGAGGGRGRVRSWGWTSWGGGEHRGPCLEQGRVHAPGRKSMLQRSCRPDRCRRRNGSGR